MTVSQTTCESCAMPIEAGPYCTHCTDADGVLQSFDERFERMVSWQARQKPQASRSELEADTLAYMSTLPAWQNHPKVRAAAN